MICAPPACAAPVGISRPSACSVAGGSAPPSEKSIGARSGARHQLRGRDRDAPVARVDERDRARGGCPRRARGRRPGRPRRRRRSRPRPPTRVVLRVAKAGKPRSVAACSSPAPWPSAGAWSPSPGVGVGPPASPPPPQPAKREAATASTVAALSGGRTPRTLAPGWTCAQNQDQLERKVRKFQDKSLLAFAVGPCTVPGQAEPPDGSRGTGEPICWGEPRPERRGAQALSAPARQLTPQADERGLCRCLCGAFAPIFICADVRHRPDRGVRPVGLRPVAPRSRRSRRLRRCSAPGLWTGPEVPGSVAKLLPDGTAAAPADAPEQVKQAIWAANSLQELPYRYGGGHNLKFDVKGGADCSGTVSFALHGGDLLRLAARLRLVHEVGREGQGRAGSRSTRTRATPTRHRRPPARHERRRHVAPRSRKIAASAFESGPRWRPMPRSGKGFVKRHPLSF